MTKVILIYANCQNPTAKGDYAFAGAIARDLASELEASNIDDIKVVLTSTLSGLQRFKKLYTKVDSDSVSIYGKVVGLCALELFDPVENSVVAFIEANRCNYAPTDIIKRALSPDSKFVFIGAANRRALSSLNLQSQYHMMIQMQQPTLYTAFDSKDMFFGASGLGTDRSGLPEIIPAKKMPELSYTQSSVIPDTKYGFMYLANIDTHTEARLISQYMKLTGKDTYMLVGNFNVHSSYIASAYRSDTSLKTTKKDLPDIHYHSSLEYPVMRKAQAGSSTALVLSTGVMSTLEALQDGKLPLYQDLENNTEFVASYLIAVKSIVQNDDTLFGCMPKLITELSTYLFAPKPLTNLQMAEVDSLLKISPVCTRMKEVNQTIIAHANGKLVPNLLSFIGTTKSTKDNEQLLSVLMSLRKKGELNTPIHDQALRRAAAWGRLFELKVIMKVMSVSDLDKQDSSNQRNALHWASICQNQDCARALIQGGVALDLQDKDGKTALHHAVQKGNKNIIKLLVNAGASLDILDALNKSPVDCTADSETLLFIHKCGTHYSKF